MNKKKKELEVKFHPSFWKSYDKLFSNNLIYLIPRTLDDIKYEIKWAWQRIFRGYDDRTVWSLKSDIYNHLPKIIRSLEETAHGYPANPFNKKNEINSLKQWKEILEKIAKGFDAAKRLDNLEYMIKSKEKYTEGFFKGSFKSIPDKLKFKKDLKEFDEGMKLFHKYFFNLWD